MKGCRPLNLDEEELITKSFAGTYATRDRAIFVLGTKSGFRISELLSLKIGDVVQNARPVDRVYVRRRNMKKKIEGRSVILHPEAKQALAKWLVQLRRQGDISDDTYLFRSRKGLNGPISRVQYYKVLREAFDANELTGKLGTHTMRKTFANKVYDGLDRDLVKTAQALGHKNINSTVQYLSFRQEDIDEAILQL